MDKYKLPNGSLISFFSNKVKQFGGINLAQGIPGFAPPDELLQSLQNIVFQPIHQYAPGTGDHKLVSLLLEKYQTDYPFTKDNFLVVNGATEAGSLVFTYLNKKFADNWATLDFDPFYETYNNLPRVFNRRFVPFYLNTDYSIDFDKLETEIKKQNVRLVFVNTPGNPFGKFFTKQEFENLLALSKKYDFYVLIDAVYRELYFDSKPHLPLSSFSERIFYVNSFSKLFSITGWRIGYLIAHQSHIADLLDIHDYTGLCAPSILQKAIANYCQSSDFGKSYVTDLRQKLKTSFEMLAPELTKLGFQIPKISGGYFIWAKLPEQFDDGFRFAIDLYDKQRVAVIPGIHFSDKGKSHIRINIARNEAEITAAIQGFNNFI